MGIKEALEILNDKISKAETAIADGHQMERERESLLNTVKLIRDILSEEVTDTDATDYARAFLKRLAFDTAEKFKEVFLTSWYGFRVNYSDNANCIRLFGEDAVFKATHFALWILDCQSLGVNYNGTR